MAWIDVWNEISFDNNWFLIERPKGNYLLMTEITTITGNRIWIASKNSGPSTNTKKSQKKMNDENNYRKTSNNPDLKISPIPFPFAIQQSDSIIPGTYNPVHHRSMTFLTISLKNLNQTIFSPIHKRLFRPPVSCLVLSCLMNFFFPLFFLHLFTLICL